MNRRVYIVHGFEGNPHGNWFDWLCAQVKSTGAQAISLAMPNPDKPSTTAWQFTLDQHIGKPDAHTFLVGHSLGCITLLHFLSRQQPQKIGGLLLAAGLPIRCLPCLHSMPTLKQRRPISTSCAKSTCPNTVWFPITTPMFRPN